MKDLVRDQAMKECRWLIRRHQKVDGGGCAER
jgi:hypothetical protein